MHPSPRCIDHLHLVQDSHVDPILVPEFFRCADNEGFFLVDNPADIVRDPSGGKGGVRASLEDDYFQLGQSTLCLRGRAHPGCIAADDNQLYLGHDYFSFSVPAIYQVSSVLILLNYVSACLTLACSGGLLFEAGQNGLEKCVLDELGDDLPGAGFRISYRARDIRPGGNLLL